jgi:hypothetical protein
MAASAAVVLFVLCSSGRAAAQAGTAPDPHAAQPERPTVATHAHTVAPGWIEVETGVQRQQEGALADKLAMPVVFKIGLGRRLQLDIVPGWERDAESGRIQSGITDLLVGVKWRLADAAPVLGTFAIQTTVSLPTGNAAAGRGTGSAGLNLLAISSHQFGPVSVDANVGYTRLGGDGSIAPNNATLWTVAAGFPVAGRVAWAAEVFGLPGTSGSGGAPPIVAFLTGPTFTVRPSLVLDAGGIFDIAGFGGTAVYAGVTWNIGRIWRSSRHPSRSPSPRTRGVGINYDHEPRPVMVL